MAVKWVTGVTVNFSGGYFRRPHGARLRTTTTVAGGYYLFDDLYGGDYVVVIPLATSCRRSVVNYLSSGTTISNCGRSLRNSLPDLPIATRILTIMARFKPLVP